MSVGAFAFFGNDFGGGPVNFGSSNGWTEENLSTPWIGGGLGVFLDFTYLEIDAGLTFADGNVRYTGTDEYGDAYDEEGEPMSAMFLNLGALLKIPFGVGANGILYPAVGVDYAMCLSASIDDEDAFDNAGNGSQLWIKFVLGGDFARSEKTFFRCALSYGIGLTSKETKDWVNYIKEEGFKASSTISQGIAINIGIGRRF